MVYRISGWMYRLGLEGFLGLKKRGNRLEVEPRIPGTGLAFASVTGLDWQPMSFRSRIRARSTRECSKYS